MQRTTTFIWQEALLRDWQSHSHVRWHCKSHIVFVPKDRRRVRYGQLRRSIGRIIREVGQQPGGELVEGYARRDPGPLCLSLPPQYSVAHTGGWLKGKSAIRIHREFLGRERHVTGLHGWARGDDVSTVGLDEQVIRAYIRHHEQEASRQQELQLTAL